jgi:hypothetical protein
VLGISVRRFHPLRPCPAASSSFPLFGICLPRSASAMSCGHMQQA